MSGMNVYGSQVILFCGVFLVSPILNNMLPPKTLHSGSLGSLDCRSEKDCVANAYCIDKGYCMCKDEFVEDTISRTCLPKATAINSTCSIDVQCTSMFGVHAQCYQPPSGPGQGQCRCKVNAHYQDGICYESIRLGGTCKVSDNCVSKSSVATYCAQSVCVCTVHHHPSDDGLDCLPDVDLGDVCRKDEDCVTPLSYCSGTCRCQTGYVVSADDVRCLLASKHLGGSCEENSQCQVDFPNMQCDLQEHVCKCAPSTHELDHTCWISADLGDPCFHPSQCTVSLLNRSAVTCFRGVCTCASGFTKRGIECVRQVVKDGTNEGWSLHTCVYLTILTMICLMVCK